MAVYTDRSRRAWRTVITIVLLGVVGLTGCSSGSAAAAPAPAPSAAPSPKPTVGPGTRRLRRCVELERGGDPAPEAGLPGRRSRPGDARSLHRLGLPRQPARPDPGACGPGRALVRRCGDQQRGDRSEERPGARVRERLPDRAG